MGSHRFWGSAPGKSEVGCMGRKSIFPNTAFLAFPSLCMPLPNSGCMDLCPYKLYSAWHTYVHVHAMDFVTDL